MRTAILVFLVSLGLSTPALICAQTDAPPVKVTLYPAAAPRPALKYQLLPPFMERRPGNAAVWWNRLPAERMMFIREMEKESAPPDGKIAKWMDLPIGSSGEKEYRTKELASVRGMLDGGSSIFADMERAARFESCDWQLPVREGNYIAMLLPEMQQSRTYARLLSAKAHLEIAEGRYDDAVRTFQVGYAQARHLTQGPTIINGLIGVTIAGIMNWQVQQFIQQPDAPNLYWALSTLPRPIVDFRLAGEAESNILYLQFPELRDLAKKTFTPEEWTALLNRAIEASRSLSSKPVSPNAHRAAMLMSIVQGYPLAKRHLIEAGRTAAEVDAMPVAQVVMLYTVKLYDEQSDEQFKWFFLPAAEAGDGVQRAVDQMRQAFWAQKEVLPFASILLPAAASAKNAETRCQWTINILRVCEAMRLYAAVHDGHWPERLSDITEVPVPLNPYDGKPFVYHRDGNKAILTSQKGPPNVPWQYEITLKGESQ